MAKPFCVTNKPVALAPGTKIVKACDFQQFVSAKELVRMAEQEAEKIKNDATAIYEAEKKRGRAEGIELGKQEMAGAISKAVLQCDAYINSIETQIVETVISALRIILADIGEQNVIFQLVTKALKTVRKDDHLKLKVFPGQLDEVRRLVLSLQEAGDVPLHIDVAPEETLKSGSCIISSKAGSTDISLDVQLELIRATLNDRMLRNKSHE